jgi:hypothetical protein
VVAFISADSSPMAGVNIVSRKTAQLPWKITGCIW